MSQKEPEQSQDITRIVRRARENDAAAAEIQRISEGIQRAQSELAKAEAAFHRCQGALEESGAALGFENLEAVVQAFRENTLGLRDALKGENA